MSYLVHLRQFEGPLGLLLYLIRKEEMDIFDINVNAITGQYLEYIRLMKELDLELAGEFVAMAATLIHIKSKMLLPNYNEEGEVVEAEDPRKELVQKLLEYQRYQEVAKKLYDRPLMGRDVFSRGVRVDFRTDEELGEVIIEEDGLFSLIAAYRKSIRKAARMVHQVRPRVQSIAMRVMEIKERLVIGTRVILRDLLQIGDAPTRTQLLITFLSMLELGRMGYVSIFQNEIYGDIYIDPKRAIERNVLERVQEFDSGDAEAVAASLISSANEEREAEQEQIDLGGEMALSGDQLALLPTDDASGAALDVTDVTEMASDEEIFAAELEIDLHAHDLTPVPANLVSTDAAPAAPEVDHTIAHGAAQAAGMTDEELEAELARTYAAEDLTGVKHAPFGTSDGIHDEPLTPADDEPPGPDGQV